MRRVHHRLQVWIAGGQAWNGDLGGGGVAFGIGGADFDAEGSLLALGLLQFGGEALDKRGELGVAAREAVDLAVELTKCGDGVRRRSAAPLPPRWLWQGWLGTLGIPQCRDMRRAKQRPSLWPFGMPLVPCGRPKPRGATGVTGAAVF